MSLDARRTAKLLTLAALAAPFVIVQGLRSISGGGVAPVPASTLNADPPAPASRPTARITPEQRAALEWLASLPKVAEGSSPMDGAGPAEPAPLGPPTEPGEPPLSRFRISAIMGTGDRGFVALDGRVLRLGQEAAPGWTVTRIDAENWTVEFKGPDGEIETIRRPQ